MPQWNRNTAMLRRRYPDERWVGACPRASASVLRRADHHVVQVGGRAALLLTYPWDLIPEDAWPVELTFEVSFTYPSGHPVAPEAVQEIVDGLTFKPLALASDEGLQGQDAARRQVPTTSDAMEEHFDEFFQRLFTEFARLGISPDEAAALGNPGFEMPPEDFFALTKGLPDGSGADALRSAVMTKLGFRAR